MKKSPMYEALRKETIALKTDIQRENKLQNVLQGNEIFYRTIWENSMAGLYVVQNGRFQAVNPFTTSFTGYSSEELIGRKPDSIIHPDDKNEVKRHAHDMLSGKREEPYAFRIISKNKEIRWVMEHIISTHFNGKPAILGNSMDITARKTFESRLKESENLYRAIFETTGTATIITEEDMTISLMNSEFERLTGYRKEEWEGKRKWTDYIPKEYLSLMKKYHKLRRLEPNAAPRNYEHKIICSNGKILNIFLTVDMIPGTTKSVASHIDITRWKKAEEKLRESEDLYRVIFETTGTATVIIEEDMTISLLNSEFERMTGYRREEWEGKKKWTDYVVKEDLLKMMEYHARRRVDPSTVPRNYEHGLIDSHGRTRHILLTVDMIPGTKKSVASFMDVTDWKEAEEGLKKREEELQIKSRNLSELNSALRVLLKQREEDREEFEEKVTANVKEFVLPYVERIKKSKILEKDMAYVSILESNLNDIISPFSRKLSSKYMQLTPKEVQIAYLIKEGKTSKEIAEIMNTSKCAIDIHRYRLRNKLGLNNKKANLRTHLTNIS
jgi:PAS domain S-box-containing protein